VNPRHAERTPDERSWIGLAAAWGLALTLLIAWLSLTPASALRTHLKLAQFWSLEICLALVLGAGFLFLRELRGTVERGDTLRVLALAALSLGLVLLMAPRTNRIYYDEQIYQSIGQSLSDVKLAQMCNDGTVEYGQLQCWNGEYNKQPYAYPHLLSVAYRLFGVHEPAAAFVNAVVMALTAAAVYLLTLVLFQDRVAAGFAGLILALLPEQIMWSATAASEPSASLAAVVAFLGAAQFCRSRSSVALIFTTVGTAYAVQFRPESFLIVPAIALLLWISAREEFSRQRLWWAGLLGLALVAVHIGHTFAVRNEGWGTSEARLSLAYVAANLRINAGFYLGDARFPVAVTLLGVAGFFDRPFRRGRLAVGGYFAFFFVMYLMFYAGSYNYGADVRYSLMTYPPLAVLGGLGAARLSRVLERLTTLPGAPAMRHVVGAALGLQFLWYAPLVRATTEEAWAARADVAFAESMASELRGNKYVLTHNPGMFHVWGVNAGQMSLIVNNPVHLDHLLRRYSGGVYLHWNFWCNVQDPIQQEFCGRALAGQSGRLEREHRERDQRFAFYELSR
jgi:4-amino-4-deoxy-L-arabinose transferase-like glycosyltransferase